MLNTELLFAGELMMVCSTVVVGAVVVVVEAVVRWMPGSTLNSARSRAATTANARIIINGVV